MTKQTLQQIYEIAHDYDFLRTLDYKVEGKENVRSRYVGSEYTDIASDMYRMNEFCDQEYAKIGQDALTDNDIARIEEARALGMTEYFNDMSYDDVNNISDLCEKYQEYNPDAKLNMDEINEYSDKFSYIEDDENIEPYVDEKLSEDQIFGTVEKAEDTNDNEEVSSDDLSEVASEENSNEDVETQAEETDLSESESQENNDEVVDTQSEDINQSESEIETLDVLPPENSETDDLSEDSTEDIIESKSEGQEENINQDEAEIETLDALPPEEQAADDLSEDTAIGEDKENENADLSEDNIETLDDVPPEQEKQEDVDLSEDNNVSNVDSNEETNDESEEDENTL